MLRFREIVTSKIDNAFEKFYTKRFRCIRSKIQKKLKKIEKYQKIKKIEFLLYEFPRIQYGNNSKKKEEGPAQIGTFGGRKLEIKKECRYFRAYLSEIDLNIYMGLRLEVVV